MATASIFQNYVHLVEHKSLIIITKQIQEGKYKEQVEAIRKLIAEGQDKEADKLKKQLSAFTPSGTFDNGRKAELLTQYSGYVILDLDKLNPEDLDKAKNLVATIPFTFAAFTSPSGNGLKIIVPVNSTAEHHNLAFQQVSDYYEHALQLPIDPSGKDVSRLCFMSYDPDCYRNIHAEKFSVNINQVIDHSRQPLHRELKINGENKNWFEVFSNCVDFTNQKTCYQNGNRNNYIHQLACNCNRSGIPEHVTEEYILQQFDLDSKESMATVRSAYKNNIVDFAKFANTAKFAVSDNLENDTDQPQDCLKITPTIPEEVINQMPEFLKEGSRAFEDVRKRDVFITSALCIISGCLPEVQGIYHQERIYPHLFSFIIAPAASGKGVLKNAKKLGDKIHDRLIATSKQEEQKYNADMVEYKQMISKRKKDDPIPDKPKEPAFKLLFIPADCSQAMMMQILQDNDGRGIICETEADAMSGANKQDWGNYSHIMRAAFHHEKISAARKTNREILEVNKPQLAVTLSGTPAQVPRLIASAEDGLFSRFLFYAYKNNIVWLDPSPKPGGIVFNDHFEMLSNKLMVIADFLTENPTQVLLTQSQWDKLNEAFYDKLVNVVVYNSEDAAGVVYRLGIILFRFCMVFTALRKFENGDCSTEVTCTDIDFNIAMTLSDIYLEHSLLMFNNLTDNAEPILYKMPNNKRKLLELLPQDFQRKEAVELGRKIGISERSVDIFLTNSVPKLLSKPRTGYYQKVK